MRSSSRISHHRYRARPSIDGLESRSLLSSATAAHAQVRAAAHNGSGTINAKLDQDLTYDGPAGPIHVVAHYTENQSYNPNGMVYQTSTFFKTSGGNGYVNTANGKLYGYYTETIQGSLKASFHDPLRFWVDSANNIASTTTHQNIPVKITQKLTYGGRVIYSNSYRASATFSPQIYLGAFTGHYPKVLSGQVNKVEDGARIHVLWKLRP